jgi:hypothetical protein
MYTRAALGCYLFACLHRALLIELSVLLAIARDKQLLL